MRHPLLRRAIIGTLSITCLCVIIGVAFDPIAPEQDIPDTPPPPPILNNVNVALVLGGGGSRSLAHLGVIKAFEEHHIPINLIVGTSAGSIMGALYADNPNADSVKATLIRLKQGDLLDPHYSMALKGLLSLKGLIQGYKLQRFLLEKLRSKQFEELKIPLVTVATDAETDKAEIFLSGPIVPAVHASSAMQPYFTPVRLYQKTYIDGGVVEPVPVNIAKQFNPKVIIAVNISTPPAKAKSNNMFSLFMRTVDRTFYELNCKQGELADVHIHPDLTGFGTFDDDRNEEIFRLGKEAALAMMPEVKQALRNAGVKI